MAVKKKYDRNVLGRGLDQIDNGRGLDALIDTHSEVKTEGSSNLNEVSITQITPNPNQPRREFDPEALQEGGQSIRELGIIQPITLRKVEGEKYQIIAGERRWRASQLAGLTKIPAYIVSVEDQGVMEMALVENIQREDLNAIEIALAYQHLAETTGMTQAKISERVGKSRAAITNYMRLLKLPAQVQIALKNHEIEMGHARALLSIDGVRHSKSRLFKEVQQHQFVRTQGRRNGAGAEAGRKCRNHQRAHCLEVTNSARRIQRFEGTTLSVFPSQGADDLLAERQGKDQHRF